jgi:hypothetical protein
MGAWFWWMGGAQDKFTLLEVKDMMSGLPGTPGTSKAKEIFSYCIFFSLNLSIGHDERLTRNTRYV